jgi:hypothetical protein
VPRSALLAFQTSRRRVRCWLLYPDSAASTLYAASGRLMPFNSNSPTFEAVALLAVDAMIHRLAVPVGETL